MAGRKSAARGRLMLVPGRSLHLASLDELLDHLGGMLLCAQAKLTGTHAKQHLLDAGCDELLELGAPPAFFQAPFA